MRFIVSLVAVLTALGVGAFAFLSAERTIAVPALAIASPQVAPESRSVAAPSRHTPDSQFAQVGAAETPGASGAPTRVEQASPIFRTKHLLPRSSSAASHSQQARRSS